MYITSIRVGNIDQGVIYLERAIGADENSPHMNRMLCALARLYSLKKDLGLAREIQAKVFSRMGWGRAALAGYEFTQELWFSGNSANFDNLINNLIVDNSDLMILEIGSLQGMSACYINDLVPVDKNLKLICIDPKFQSEFFENIKLSLNPSRIIPIELPSQVVLDFFEPNRFHLIHVDGWHVAPQVFLDGFLAAKLLLDGGYIVFDDYLKEDQTRIGQSVKMGVKAFLLVFGKWFDVMSEGRQLVCVRRSVIIPAEVALKVEELLGKVVGAKVSLHGNTLTDIYSSIMSYSDALFSASWSMVEN
jgi:hypothetical protein